MKKLFYVLLLIAMLIPQTAAAADPYADVTNVSMSGAILTVSGTAPFRATVYTKVVKSGFDINVYVYRRGGCPECGQGIPYTKTVNLKRYITPTHQQEIYVNGVQYFP
jgi:hypothetical protein